MLSLEDVLKRDHDPVSRVRFLDADFSLLHEVTALIGGSCTMDGRDTHRSASVTIGAEDDTYRPRSLASFVWPNALVQVGRGAIIGTTAQYRTLITGLIDDPKESADSGEVSFSVLSRLTLMERQFGDPVTFSAGERVSVVIRLIAEMAGFGTSDDLYDLTSGGQTLPATVTFDASAEMLRSMVKLASDAGCELYDTGDGVLTMRPFVDPSTVEPVWDFDTTLVSLDRSLQSLGVYNRQDVIGVGPDGYPVHGRAVVTNPADPLYWTTSNDRPAPVYRPAFPVTQQMANAIAKRKLIDSALFEESIGASASFSLVDDRDVARFAGAGVDDKFLLASVTAQLGPGTMSLTTKRVRSLIA